MRARGRSFETIPVSEHVMVVEGCFWLILAQVCLSILSFRRVYSILEGASRNRPSSLDLGQRYDQTVDEVRLGLSRASRFLPWMPRCLTQALAGWAMLSTRGIRSNLRIGVKVPGFEAHAWLCADGLPVSGVPLAEGFTVVAEFNS